MGYYGVKRLACGKDKAGEFPSLCCAADGRQCGPNGCTIDKAEKKQVVLEGKIIANPDKSVSLLHEVKADRA